MARHREWAAFCRWHDRPGPDTLAAWKRTERRLAATEAGRP
jgi:hypothetical protein